jgi:hypothetical protein
LPQPNNNPYPLPPKSASVDAWSRYGETVTLNNIQPGDMLFWPGNSHIGFATSAPKNGKVSVISGNYGSTDQGSVQEVTLPLSTFAQARRPGPGYLSYTGPQLTSNAAPPTLTAAASISVLRDATIGNETDTTNPQQTSSVSPTSSSFSSFLSALSTAFQTNQSPSSFSEQSSSEDRNLAAAFNLTSS